MVEILSEKYDVTVITQPHPERIDWISHLAIPNPNIVQLKAKSAYSYMPKLRRILRLNEFDLYISFGYGKFFTDYIGWYAKKHKKPSIVFPCGFFHTNQKSLYKRLYAWFMTRWTLNNFTMRITATQQERDFWISKFYVTPDNFHVVPYNLDKNFTKFKETDILEKNELKKKRYLLYVGRTGPNKLIQLLKDAYVKTSKKIPLVIAGKGTEIFGGLGSISEDDKKTLIKNAKLCVFPSSYESFGLSAIEPIVLKTPVICSNIGPFMELIENNDLLFDNNIESLAIKIEDSFIKTFEIPKLSLPDEKENLYKLIDTIIM